MKFISPQLRINYLIKIITCQTEFDQINFQIAKLLKKNVIRKCKFTEGQIVSSIFLVPKLNGLILNLKNLNKFIENSSLKIIKLLLKLFLKTVLWLK